ncbi:BZ3500_MvSof-1268-A1-R1_Chr3-1g05435 [Microbotryum saponariae]|uniref:BZ3500_MvSof-1268-A1-R1_Chr3-1g05435 protein n=1 Tax=Microbotryum saponariae TaxID=289078 RepID=A0A2X0L2D9_9BASI|nr:BZ3500_MvSof-1268-A1-R1_Chr3-1g05435 [Microbotryum saponariae]SDA04626.1 BZ3501_MvSof-1269-A2-R1_Chr3-1g05106 [Microbotryum saponariae]
MATTTSTSGPKALSTAHDLAELVRRHDTFLFDCDGVIWSGPAGDVLTPHIIPTLHYLRSLQKRCCFVTNNATRSRQDYHRKFHRLGLVDVQLDDIFTCGSATASYVKEVVLPEIKEKGGKEGIYLIGQESMEQELRREGLQWTGGTDPEDDVLLADQDFSSITPDPEIGMVVYSFQMRINYKQLAKAFNYLGSNSGCRLILTNDDHSMTAKGGGILPGEGAIASVLYGARKDLKPLVVGKPYKPLLDVVQRTLEYDPEKTIFVGDRLETDVLFGRRGGLTTLLVWTGFSKPSHLTSLSVDELPHYTTDSVGELLKAKEVFDVHGHDGETHESVPEPEVKI